MKSWKHWPYWLRGGVIGGGVTIADILLLSSCNFITSGHSTFGCGLVYVVFGPLWPVALLIKYFGFVFPSERVLIIIAVVTWFTVGAVVGTLTSFVKKKKSSMNELFEKELT